MLLLILTFLSLIKDPADKDLGKSKKQIKNFFRLSRVVVRALDLITDKEEIVEVEAAAATDFDIIETLLSNVNLQTHHFDAYQSLLKVKTLINSVEHLAKEDRPWTANLWTSCKPSMI